MKSKNHHYPRIVCVGGGTGQAAVLRGLKEFTNRITAVVTVTDTGRSSGKLRRELGILPPGDIRNCLVSLSRSEQLLQDLFQLRFRKGRGLRGMSFGNLFIAALTQLTGNFDLAVKEASKILAIRGKVLPSTLQKAHICARLSDKTVLKEEYNIRKINKPGIARVYLQPHTVKSYPECINEIMRADLIVIGPGSLYTSVICNMLIKDIVRAIRQSPAKKVYVCNLMTQPGQTDGYTAEKHVREVVRYLGKDVLDYVIFNNELPPPEILRKYARDRAYPLELNLEEIRKIRATPILADIVEKDREKQKLWRKQDLLRHDSFKLARILINLI